MSEKSRPNNEKSDVNNEAMSISSEITHLSSSKRSDTEWVRHPMYPNLYVKKFGRLWNKIHQNQLSLSRVGIPKSDNLEKFYSESFGSAQFSNNILLTSRYV